METGGLLELRLQADQVPATVRCEEGAGVLALLAVTEALTPHARKLLTVARRPGENRERLRVGIPTSSAASGP